MKVQILTEVKTLEDGIIQARICKADENDQILEIHSTMWSMYGETMEAFLKRVSHNVVEFANMIQG